MVQPVFGLVTVSQIPAHSANADPTWPATGCFGLSERLAVCGRLLRSRLGPYLVQRGTSEAEFSLLWACLEAPAIGLSQSEIAARLAVSAAHISGLVESLRRKGWLKRRASAADRRQRVWRLTPSGRTLLDAVLSDTCQWAAALEERMGKQQTASLTCLLDELAEALRGEEPCARSSGPHLRRFEPAPRADILSNQPPGRQGGRP